MVRFIRGFCFFFSSRRRHTRCSRDWSSDVCSSDLSPSVFKRRRATEGECERFAVSHFLGPRTAKAFRRGGNAPLRVGFAVSAGKRRARLVAAAFRWARPSGKVNRATNGARQKRTERRRGGEEGKSPG